MLEFTRGELTFVAVLVIIVLLAQIAPKIGEAIAARAERRGDGDPGRPPHPPG